MTLPVRCLLFGGAESAGVIEFRGRVQVGYYLNVAEPEVPAMATSSPLQGGRSVESRKCVDVNRASHGDAGAYDGEYGDDA